MNTPSLIFLTIFVLPLLVFTIWLILKDKKNGKKVIGFLCLLSLIHAAQSFFPKRIETIIQVSAIAVIVIYFFSSLNRPEMS